MEKLTIQLGKNKIVAEVYEVSPDAPPELCVYLCDEKNVILQDICLVRPHYDADRKTLEFKTENDFVDCIVWGDSDNEDYTDKHVIAVRDEEDEK